MIAVLTGETITDAEYLRRIALTLQEDGHQAEASVVDEIAGRINQDA